MKNCLFIKKIQVLRPTLTLINKFNHRDTYLKSDCNYYTVFSKNSMQQYNNMWLKECYGQKFCKIRNQTVLPFYYLHQYCDVTVAIVLYFYIKKYYIFIGYFTILHWVIGFDITLNIYSTVVYSILNTNVFAESNFHVGKVALENFATLQ